MNRSQALTGEKAFMRACMMDDCTLDWRWMIETNLDVSVASPSQTSSESLGALGSAADADVTLTHCTVKQNVTQTLSAL